MTKAKCDYHGECKNKAYAEVYPSLMGSKHKGEGWSYLCKKHYTLEQKRYKNKLPSWIIKIKKRKNEKSK